MKLLLVIVLLIPPLIKEHRVYNVQGNCRWAALDAAARYNGNSFKGYFREEWDKGGGSIPQANDPVVKAALDKRGSIHIFDHSSNYDLLLKHCPKHGAVVSFKPGTPGLGFHSVYLLEINPDYIYFYDVNDKQVKERTREFFNTHWWGDAIVLLPDTEE